MNIKTIIISIPLPETKSKVTRNQNFKTFLQKKSKRKQCPGIVAIRMEKRGWKINSESDTEVNVCNDKEMAHSERYTHSKNRVGEKT